MERVAAARAFLEKSLSEGRVIYGVNTGIGHLAAVRVEPAKVEELQRNIVRSHAAGMGPPLGDDEVRAVLLLKVNLFAKGHSGVRPELVRLLEAMLAEDVLPVIPAKGSLGASGDLAPLAHVGLCVLGEGEARSGGETLPAAVALERAGLAPLTLSAKEGLGLINGCQVMAGRGSLLLHDARATAEDRTGHFGRDPRRDGRVVGAVLGAGAASASVSRPAGGGRGICSASWKASGRWANACRTRTRSAASRRFSAGSRTRSTTWSAGWRSK